MVEAVVSDRWSVISGQKIRRLLVELSSSVGITEVCVAEVAIAGIRSAEIGGHAGIFFEYSRSKRSEGSCFSAKISLLRVEDCWKCKFTGSKSVQHIPRTSQPIQL